MFSILKTELPSAIQVGGSSFELKTDFHWWLSFWKLLKNQEVTEFKDVDFLYLSKKPTDRESGYMELLKFFSPEKKLPRQINTDSSHVIVYDYELDSALIYSAFMEQYKIDLFDSKMHWWKFLALLDGLHGTRFSEIVSYRCYDREDKTTHEQSMEELKQMWEIIPEEEEQKVQKDLESFNNIFWGC